MLCSVLSSVLSSVLCIINFSFEINSTSKGLNVLSCFVYRTIPMLWVVSSLNEDQHQKIKISMVVPFVGIQILSASGINYFGI